jgi:predicted alpha/beta superfamily hydrolase
MFRDKLISKHRPLQMKNLLWVGIIYLLATKALAQSANFSSNLTEAFTINSELVNDTFNIQISLPTDYYASDKEYPIVYLLDSDRSLGMVSELIWWLNFDQVIQEVIVVGIAYKNDWWNKRSRDYTPTKDYAKNWGDWPTAGGADAFIEFISVELNNELKKYRIDWTNRTIIGHSFGGLFSYYALLKKPELFKNYISISPTVIWNNNFLMTLPHDNLKNQEAQFTFFTAIGELDDAKRINTPWKKFNDYIKESKIENLTWVDSTYVNQTHSSVLPVAISDGLRLLFK